MIKASSYVFKKVKKDIEKLLKRKVRFNWVDRGMRDVYHQLSLTNQREVTKIHDYFSNHPNSKIDKKSFSQSYDATVGYLDFEKATVHIVNPVSSKPNLLALTFKEK